MTWVEISYSALDSKRPLLCRFLAPAEMSAHSMAARKFSSTPFGVKGVGFTDGLDEQKIRSAAEHARADGRIAMIFIETPSNPMNSLVEALCL
jgi:cystathionine beta-lyase/cystathionine gamma-synthase